MRIRAKLTLRNEHMLAARERLGISQVALADRVGVPIPIVSALEALDYSILTERTRGARERQVRAIAQELGLAPELVAPEGLDGNRIASTATRVIEGEPSSLLGLSRSAYQLASGELEGSEVARGEAREILDKILGSLPKRDAQVLALRQIDGHSLVEIAHRQRCSPERIRQIEIRAVAAARIVARQMTQGAL